MLLAQTHYEPMRENRVLAALLSRRPDIKLPGKLLVAGLALSVWHDMGHPLVLPSTSGVHTASRS